MRWSFCLHHSSWLWEMLVLVEFPSIRLFEHRQDSMLAILGKYELQQAVSQKEAAFSATGNIAECLSLTALIWTEKDSGFFAKYWAQHLLLSKFRHTQLPLQSSGQRLLTGNFLQQLHLNKKFNINFRIGPVQKPPCYVFWNYISFYISYPPIFPVRLNRLYWQRSMTEFLKGKLSGGSWGFELQAAMLFVYIS